MELIKYSGVIAMFIAWFFVVAPSLHAGIDKKKDTISTATKDGKYGMVIGLGLILGGLFQIIFLYYLITKFSIGYFNFGVLLYFATALVTILVSVITENKYPKLHLKLTEFYFIFNPISILLISFSIKHNYTGLFFFSMFIALVYFSGMLYLRSKFRNRNAKMEIWGFSLLSLWTIVLTFV